MTLYHDGEDSDSDSGKLRFKLQFLCLYNEKIILSPCWSMRIRKDACNHLFRFLGLLKELPQMEWFKTTGIYFFHSSGGQKTEIEVSAEPFSLQTLQGASLLASPHRWWLHDIFGCGCISPSPIFFLFIIFPSLVSLCACYKDTCHWI